MGNLMLGCHGILLREGWEVWKKYEFLFPHPNYLIFEEEQIRGDQELHPLFFINKKNIQTILCQHIDLLKKEVDPSFDAAHFLSELEQSFNLSELIHFHEGVLGLLLGFGVESSMSYYYREFPLGIFRKERDQLDRIGGAQSSTLHFSTAIAFCGKCDSQEVQEIVRQNREERRALKKIYSEGDLLEITLKKIMQK